MLRKMLTTLAVGVVGLFALGGVAAAAPPYPAPPPIVININGPIIINGPVIIFGGGFLPNEPINITIVYNTGGPNGLRSSNALSQLQASKQARKQADQADASGNFDAEVVFTQAGSATVTATGLISGHTDVSTFQVPAAGAAGGDSSTTTAMAADGSSWTASPTAAGMNLASTGASVAGPIAIGLGALFAGLSLLFFGTRGAIRRKGAQPITEA